MDVLSVIVILDRPATNEMNAPSEHCGEAKHTPAFLDSAEADAFLARLSTDLPWSEYVWSPGLSVLPQVLDVVVDFTRCSQVDFVLVGLRLRSGSKASSPEP